MSIYFPAPFIFNEPGHEVNPATCFAAATNTCSKFKCVNVEHKGSSGLSQGRYSSRPCGCHCYGWTDPIEGEGLNSSYHSSPDSSTSPLGSAR
ncbi:unnamed protein product [Schistocephalus solidus]|uniref:Secreted protein n=1 Tax=Schistocephalus solidus TaxID=70667 RepID=A0A183SCY8_SCHSO|nr:unnamed protein product [Schistocephalus solidus]